MRSEKKPTPSPYLVEDLPIDAKEPPALSRETAEWPLTQCRHRIARATCFLTTFATPYGRFDRIVPPPPESNPYFSRVNFEHFDIATDAATLDREFPRGKRMEIPGQQRDHRNSTIFDGHHG